MLFSLHYMLNNIVYNIMQLWKDRDNMKCKIRGEKIKITASIQEYVENKLSKLDKYFKELEIEANVLIRIRGKEHIIEVTIPYDKYTLRGEERQEDLYAAIDLVIDKIEGQIRKTKAKLKKQIKQNNEFFNFDYEVTKEEAEESKIVKRKTLEMKPMDEEEAILELELLGHDFFIYKDVHTNGINLLYKRKDGNYGVIETNE